MFEVRFKAELKLVDIGPKKATRFNGIEMVKAQLVGWIEKHADE